MTFVTDGRTAPIIYKSSWVNYISKLLNIQYQTSTDLNTMFFMTEGLFFSDFPGLFSTCYQKVRCMTLGFTKEYLDVGRVSNSAEGHIHLTMREEVGSKVEPCSVQGLALSLHVESCRRFLDLKRKTLLAVSAKPNLMGNCLRLRTKGTALVLLMQVMRGKRRMEPMLLLETERSSRMCGRMLTTQYFTPLQWPASVSMFRNRMTMQPGFSLSR